AVGARGERVGAGELQESGVLVERRRDVRVRQVVQKAARRRLALASRCSGSTFTSPSTGMKLVSPFQRGTTCRWTWSSIPAPATRRLSPRGLSRGGASPFGSAPSPLGGSR